jgi:hypothetical protein
MVWIVNMNILYVITCVARKDEFSAGLPSMESMINSFQIAGNPVESNDLILNNENFVVFENRKLGFMIEYPPDWIAESVTFAHYVKRAPFDNPRYLDRFRI